jgi:hypothetical protein
MSNWVSKMNLSLRRRTKEAAKGLDFLGDGDLDVGETREKVLARRRHRPTLVELGEDGDDPGGSRVKYRGTYG